MKDIKARAGKLRDQVEKLLGAGQDLLYNLPSKEKTEKREALWYKIFAMLGVLESIDGRLCFQKAAKKEELCFQKMTEEKMEGLESEFKEAIHRYKLCQKEFDELL